MAGRSPNSHVSIVHSDSGAVIPTPPGLPTDHMSSFHMASDVEGPESSPMSRTSVAPGLDLPNDPSPLHHVVSDVYTESGQSASGSAPVIDIDLARSATAPLKKISRNFRVNREMRGKIL